MIVTTIRIQMNSENRKELLQTLSSLTQPIQDERGCKSYRVYREVGNDETVIVVQEWVSQMHWHEHLQSEKFSIMMGAMTLLESAEAFDFQVMNQLEQFHSVEDIRARNLVALR